MINEFQYLLAMIGSYIQGIEFVEAKEVDWYKMIEIAKKQNVYYLFSAAVLHYKLNCPIDILETMKEKLDSIVLWDKIRKNKINSFFLLITESFTLSLAVKKHRFYGVCAAFWLTNLEY